MSGQDYIGSKISLTSLSELRYVGILHHINSLESTVALQNVTSFGTEGRKWGREEILGSDIVFDYIVFRGSDIKELQVFEAPPSSFHHAHQKDTVDEVLVDSLVKQVADLDIKMADSVITKRPKDQAGKDKRESPFKRKNNEHNTSTKRKDRPRKQQRRRLIVPTSDFDFVSSNAKFEKHSDTPEPDRFYYYDKKKSFFDGISYDTKDPRSYKEERKLNLETFGQANIRHHRRKRHFSVNKND